MLPTSCNTATYPIPLLLLLQDTNLFIDNIPSFFCRHFSKPYLPEIPGLNKFPGEVTHSHTFRRNNQFVGKRVLIVGTMPSGCDTLIQVSPVASSICLVYHNSPVQFKLPPNAEQQPQIVGIDTDGTVHFENGESRVVDEIILCTGYQYNYPFLSSDSGIEVEAGKCVKHLYKHMFNIEHPSMVFVGLNYPVCPFAFFDVQARFILSVLTGQTQLPSQEDMIAECLSEYARKSREGVPLKHNHRLVHQMPFIKELTEMAGLKPHPPKYEKLEVLYEYKKYDLLNYRKYEYSFNENSKGEIEVTRQFHTAEE